MKVIIIGAGEVGAGLAGTFCIEGNEVTIIDTDESRLDLVAGKYDLMTIVGNGANAQILRKAGAKEGSLLVCVTHSDDMNVLACHTAKLINPDLISVCRISDPDYFDAECETVEARHYGIDHLVIPQVECVSAILDVLENPDLKERIALSVPGAVISGFHLAPGSPMIGEQLYKFPRPDLLQKVRICGVWRRGRLIIPRGRERFNNYDEIYVAGDSSAVQSLIDWSTIEDRQVRRVILAGASCLGMLLAQRLQQQGYSLAIIEEDQAKAEHALGQLPSSVKVFHGSPGDSDILSEADVEGADAFISCQTSDEANVLSCLLAKRIGANKVVAIVNKADYREIISSMDAIDCCFSPRIAALNSIINLVKGVDRRIGAILHRISAEVYELSVTPKSPIAGKLIRDVACPDNAMFAMILRGNVITAAVGNERFEVGDTVVILGSSESLKEAYRLFVPRMFSIL